jgi:predicted nuclease of predicted toxin-antitoxin system
VRLFIDECLSPRLAARLNASGEHDAMHPRDYGRLGERDDRVLAFCVADSRTIVTENAADFRKLIGAQALHPGLIILPSVDRESSGRLLDKVLAELAARGDPGAVMVNKVVEVSAAGRIVVYEMPAF